MSWLTDPKDASLAQVDTGRSTTASRGSRLGIGVPLLAFVLVLMVAAPAFASGPAFGVHVNGPDAVAGGVRERTLVVVQNTGDAPFAGPLTFSVTFPAGIEPEGLSTPVSSSSLGLPESSCQIAAQTLTCTVPTETVLNVGEPDEHVLWMPPGSQMYFQVTAPVSPEASGTLVGSVEVSGAGTGQDLTEQESMTVGPGELFALKSFNVDALDAGGAPVVQGGSDPSGITTTLAFPTTANPLFGGFFPVTAPVEQFKDVITHVPAGLIGNPTATLSRCTEAQLSEPSPNAPHGEIPKCPVDSQVGVVRIAGSDIVPVYNMIPPYGAPAEFGFQYEGVPTLLDARVRPNDDGVDIVVRDASASVPIPSVELSLWGVPTDSSHDYLRDVCIDGLQGNNGFVCPSSAPRKAFLRMPTSCSGDPLSWGIDATSYPHPDTVVHADTTTPTLSGCEVDPFTPSLSLEPSSLTPGSPTGLDARLTVPQDAGPDGLAEADVRKVTTVLPEGLTINPSSANGLQACSDSDLRLGQDGVATCPDGSKIGTVTVKTPLLDHMVGGSVFLRTQASDDPGSGEMFRVAIEVRSDQDGIDVKLPGQIKVDAGTGRVAAVFDETPQLPFEELHVHFKEGSRAPLATPSVCGTATTTSRLDGWNGKSVVSPSSFAISGDGQGAPCPAVGFAPGFVAGAVSPVAGAFSPFTLRLTRNDGEGEFQGLSPVKLPSGLLADLSSVPVRCTDAQATATPCPVSSRVGSVVVGAGVGPDPFYTTGDVYLTGAYEGDPFGLAIIVHAQAGPFDLGYVVVRSAIHVNDDGSVTVRTDQFPRVVKGIVLHVKDVRVNLDRPGFALNPTSCEPLSITGTATSTLGQTANLSSRFQVGECSRLAFKPKFAVSTGARSSRSMGASLAVNVSMGRGQANIRGVRVRLPRQLPSRNTTLKQACVAGVFEQNPAACPSGSLVGTATARTPILANALSGPAYLVSHGGAAFPDLVIVLQGEGITLHLTGHTDIKNGVTTSTFNTLPDAPVSSFQLRLPAGSHSILAAPGGHLCQSKLVLPTLLTGQNGAVVSQARKIAVTGCSRHKARSKSKKSKKGE